MFGGKKVVHRGLPTKKGMLVTSSYVQETEKGERDSRARKSRRVGPEDERRFI